MKKEQERRLQSPCLANGHRLYSTFLFFLFFSGLSLKYTKTRRTKSKMNFARIKDIAVRGQGRLDNLTLARSAHMDHFYAAADWLVKHQDDRGGWPIMVNRVQVCGCESAVWDHVFVVHMDGVFAVHVDGVFAHMDGGCTHGWGVCTHGWGGVHVDGVFVHMDGVFVVHMDVVHVMGCLLST